MHDLEIKLFIDGKESTYWKFGPKDSVVVDSIRTEIKAIWFKWVQ